MRSLPCLFLVGFAGVALASPVMSQRADDQIQPRSVEPARGQSLVSAGKLEQAEDVLETALAVDPRNRWAFVDLARVAEKQRLYGKAIRMTSKALLIEPNDPDAIAVREKRWWRWRYGARPGEPAEAAADLRRKRLPAGGPAVVGDQPRTDRRVGQGAEQPQKN